MTSHIASIVRDVIAAHQRIIAPMIEHRSKKPSIDVTPAGIRAMLAEKEPKQ